MTQTVTKNTIVFWQTNTDGCAEEAIAIEPYQDVITLNQGDDLIRINYDSLDEFIKQLRKIKKDRP